MDILSLGECYQWARQMEASPARFQGWSVLRIERLLSVAVKIPDWGLLPDDLHGEWSIERPSVVSLQRWGMLLSHPKSGGVARVTEASQLVNFPHELPLIPGPARREWPGATETGRDTVRNWNEPASDPACRHCHGRGCVYCGASYEEWH